MFGSVLRIVTRSIWLFAALALFIYAAPALAKKARAQSAPVQASMVIDADTGRVLHAENADVTTYPASLTKMMTLYLLFDQLEAGRLRLTDRMPVSARAAAQSPSKLGLAPGQTIGVEQAILALVTKSANDVAVIIAEAISGTEDEFGDLMTRRARQLGMTRTTFRNASGLPNLSQVTTARDMALLGRALLKNHARYYHYFSARSFEWQGAVINTHNRLMLRYEGADGIKTGYIAASGFNLVSSVNRGGQRLVGVVMGGRTAAARDRRMEQLLDIAYGAPAREDRIETAAAKPKLEPAAAPQPQDKMKVLRQAAAQDKTPAKDKARAAERMTGIGDAEPAGWGVQIGAFKEKASALNAAEKAHKRYAAGRPIVTESGSGSKKVYRARLMGISQEQARALCKSMSGNKSCMVVQSGA